MERPVLNFERALEKLLGPIKRRVLLMVGRGVVRLVNDSLAVQGVQLTLLQGEVRDGVEHFQPYGLAAHPHPGAEAVVVSVGGSRDHAVAVVVGDRRYRLKALAEGEVALYDDEGSVVHLQRGGNVLVKAGKSITLEAPLVRASKELADRDGLVSLIRSIFDVHFHPVSGSTTGPPTTPIPRGGV